MTLYDCTDYKSALKFLTEDRKLKRKAVTFEAMAAHCGIQKTYLSKVLNKEGNLSSDQLYQAADFLKLSAFESSFLENLFQFNTTNVQSRKARFQHALDKARKEILKSENSIQSEKEDLHQMMVEKYYLDPYYQLIHIFLTISNYAKNHQDIGKKLGLSNASLKKYLGDLSDWKIVEFKSGTYKVLKNNLHLPKDSDYNSAFRNFSRTASQSKMNILEQDDFYSFSAIISCDDSTKEKIQKRFLDFLKNCQNDVIKSESKDVFQINFDLLKWS